MGVVYSCAPSKHSLAEQEEYGLTVEEVGVMHDEQLTPIGVEERRHRGSNLAYQCLVQIE
jgi:hypothetical protein